MKRHTLLIWLLALSVALIAAGCAAQQNAPTSAPTQAETASVPAAAETEPTLTLPAEVELPATGQEASPTVEATMGETPTAEEPVQGALEFVLVPEQSEARYRVREQLVNLSLPNDAVGVTRQISGTIRIHPDGTVDPASRFVVDLSTLQSDQSRRDNFLRQNVLQTSQYPEAVFVPTRVSGLTLPLPESGDFNFQLIGDLTLREVTREVTWDVSGSMQGDTAEGQARTSFTFDEFNLTQPRVPVVLSMEDTITLEVDGLIQQVGGQPNSGAEDSAPAAQIDCAVPAALTPPMTEGPYYTPNTPERTSLIEPGTPGTRLLLSGYVLSADCQPVRGALLDFWQTDGQGQYDNAGYGMRGHQFTDETGRYQLETVVPGSYPGRTPHIHVKVQAPGGPAVVTQLFIPGEAQNDTDRIFDSQLLVTMGEPQDDALQAEYNFIVPTQ